MHFSVIRIERKRGVLLENEFEARPLNPLTSDFRFQGNFCARFLVKSVSQQNLIVRHRRQTAFGIQPVSSNYDGAGEHGSDATEGSRDQFILRQCALNSVTAPGSRSSARFHAGTMRYQTSQVVEMLLLCKRGISIEGQQSECGAMGDCFEA